ncbi:hypothetical protein COY90_04790 [Candidatus Roizmanbacteria bacterium CG_4_10_14_0_8_um_filter_39_9]|uniref:Carboxypeptidase regulatory-like domain-containing protein n=1 Tax=Candidatus Roizmanbacteria bacterium CG_4_10_14_0_8_um_filter_39_9 TaxID=1974829 RepID=A0A2M7QCI9_9BACT|nr:MAG: hypothetical protein COY90_04790 [Candidatus Roizmanbacteria bacterium CG_4_10_14_0_8_um_filter_39_9]
MKTIKQAFVLGFVLSSLLFGGFVHAQEIPLKYVCLKSTHCYGATQSECIYGTPHGHTAKLEEEGALPTGSVFVGVCVSYIGGTGKDLQTEQVCTTGSDEKDRELFKIATGELTPLNKLKGIGYEFKNFYESDGVTSADNPTIGRFQGPYYWEDFTPTGHLRNWRAFFRQDPNDEVQAGEILSQKLGTLPFDTLEKQCVKIAWDPYGRVFDSQTLEPISGMTVSLFVKKDSDFIAFNPFAPENQPNIIKKITGNDGQYNYVVPDNEYKLAANGMITTLDLIHPNFAQAYYDVYPVQTGDVIVQKGIAQHRDIAVMSQNTNTLSKPIDVFVEAVGQGHVVIEGVVSHPLSRIYANSAKISNSNGTVKTPYRTVGSTTADKLGRFKLDIDQNGFEQKNDYIELLTSITIVKVDLRTMQEVMTARTTVSFEPIPTYLKGIAYAANGTTPLPNTKVGVYLPYSNSPSSMVTSDSSGNFVIGSEKLPSMPYELRFTTPNGMVVKTKPSVFLAQNQTYMAENQINPYEEKKTDGAKIVVKKLSSSSSSVQVGQKSVGDTTQKSGWFGLGGGQNTSSATTRSGASVSPFVMMAVILVILISAVGAGIFLYMKQKNSSSTSRWE